MSKRRTRLELEEDNMSIAQSIEKGKGRDLTSTDNWPPAAAKKEKKNVRGTPQYGSIKKNSSI
jgi:hypothetical protein